MKLRTRKQEEEIERPVMIKGPCAQLLMRQISGQTACGQSFDQYSINAGSANIAGMLWAKETVQKVFTKYIKEYGYWSWGRVAELMPKEYNP